MDTLLLAVKVIEVVVATCAAVGCVFSYRLVKAAERDVRVVHADVSQRIPRTTVQILDEETQAVRSQQRAWSIIQAMTLLMTLVLIFRPFLNQTRALLLLGGFFVITVLGAVAAVRAERSRVRIARLQADAKAKIVLGQQRSTDL